MRLSKVQTCVIFKIWFSLFVIIPYASNAQNISEFQLAPSWHTQYNEAYNQIEKVLTESGSFAKAVFIRENTFRNNFSFLILIILNL